MNNYKIESILLHIELSKTDNYSLSIAAAICKRQNARLTLLHVSDKTGPITSENSFSDEDGKWTEYLNNALHEIENKAKNIFPHFQLEINSVIISGKPADAVCKLAIEGNYSMIVIGANSITGTQEMSSVAFDVVKNAPCPVLVVQDNWDHHSFRKIVYPIRMNQKVFEKYNYIEPIIEKNNSELIIAGLADKDEPDHIIGAVFSIDLLSNMCQEENIPYTTLILPCKDLSSKLIEVANDVNADLIVISPNLDNNPQENHVEYFAQAVLSQSKCPVLCINKLRNKP